MTTSESETKIFIDGELRCYSQVRRDGYRLKGIADIILGRSSNCPVIADTFPTGVINGILRDVRIFDAQLPQGLLVDIMQQFQPGIHHRLVAVSKALDKPFS